MPASKQLLQRGDLASFRDCPKRPPGTDRTLLLWIVPIRSLRNLWTFTFMFAFAQTVTCARLQWFPQQIQMCSTFAKSLLHLACVQNTHNAPRCPQPQSRSSERSPTSFPTLSAMTQSERNDAIPTGTAPLLSASSSPGPRGPWLSRCHRCAQPACCTLRVQIPTPAFFGGTPHQI